MTDEVLGLQLALQTAEQQRDDARAALAAAADPSAATLALEVARLRRLVHTLTLERDIALKLNPPTS